MCRLFLLMLMLVSSSAFSQERNRLLIRDLRIMKLREGLAAMSSIQGNMTQSKSFSFMDRPLVSTGQFRYRKEDRLRWEFIKPTPYCILIDGPKVRLQENKKEKDLRSVDRVMQQVKEVIVGCINGKIISDPAYQAEAWAKGEDVIIALKPKDRRIRELIATIEIVFGPTAKDLRSVKLTDPSGDATLVTFDNIKTNGPISDSVFADF